ncbi:MAG: hypothetical protein ABSE72_04415 [Bacteroidales bacterium]|jgi:hypothetical protein
MKLDKESLKILRNFLPHGSSIIIRKRIHDKLNLSFSIDYINQVLHPNNNHYNTIIIEEAKLYAEEIKKKAKKEKKRIAALIK